MLSIKDASKALGVSVSTVRRWMDGHRLGYLKIGRRTVIEQSEVDRYIESLRGEQTR